MRIGVYAHDYDPSIGGGHTFVDTVIRGFINEAKSSKHEFILYSSARTQTTLATMHENSNIIVREIPKKSMVHSITRIIKNLIPRSGYFLKKFNPLEKLINQDKV